MSLHPAPTKIDAATQMRAGSALRPVKAHGTGNDYPSPGPFSVPANLGTKGQDGLRAALFTGALVMYPVLASAGLILAGLMLGGTLT